MFRSLKLTRIISYINVYGLIKGPLRNIIKSQYLKARALSSPAHSDVYNIVRLPRRREGILQETKTRYFNKHFRIARISAFVSLIFRE